MNRVAKTCAVAGLLCLSGCADVQESLIVLGAAAWPSDTAAGECVVDPSTDSFLSYGVLDFYCLDDASLCEVGTRYQLPAVLENRLLGRAAGTSNTATDPDEMQLRDVEVSYSMPQLEGALAMLPSESKHFVAPLASDSLPPGEPKGVIVEVIGPLQAEQLYDAVQAEHGSFAEVTLVVELIFTAERSGNTRGNVGVIESREFSFPIHLTHGSLLSCASCEEGACPGAVEALTWTGGVCGLSQDGAMWPTACDAP